MRQQITCVGRLNFDDSVMMCGSGGRWAYRSITQIVLHRIDVVVDDVYCALVWLQPTPLTMNIMGRRISFIQLVEKCFVVQIAVNIDGKFWTGLPLAGLHNAYVPR